MRRGSRRACRCCATALRRRLRRRRRSLQAHMRGLRARLPGPCRPRACGRSATTWPLCARPPMLPAPVCRAPAHTRRHLARRGCPAKPSAHLPQILANLVKLFHSGRWSVIKGRAKCLDCICAWPPAGSYAGGGAAGRACREHGPAWQPWWAACWMRSPRRPATSSPCPRPPWQCGPDQGKAVGGCMCSGHVRAGRQPALIDRTRLYSEAARVRARGH